MSEREKWWGERDELQDFTIHISSYKERERSDLKQPSHTEDLPIKNDEVRTWICCSTWNMTRMIENSADEGN